MARGARAAEALLLAAVREHKRAVSADPTLLARPLRIVVPSRSLREHVAAAIVRVVGTVAGVRVQTLHGLALEVIEAAAERVPWGDDLFGILVRRAARGEAPLEAALDGLEDGYASVTGAAADLLDAGFDPETESHRDALGEAIDALPSDPDARARLRAVADATAAAGRHLAKHDCGRRGTRLAMGARLLDAERLPSLGVWIHGFADATGVATDLLEALVRHQVASVILDHPPDPGDPERDDPGVRYTERLRERLALPTRLVEWDDAPPQLAAIHAVGGWGESRAVAERVHALRDERVPLERIGIVARDVAPYAVPLRTHLRRLGIPFSTIGTAGPPTGRGRRVHALLDLLEHGRATPAERWLDAWSELSPSQRADLRLGLHVLGAARVGDVADLDLERALGGQASLPLPARHGLAAAREGDDGDVGPRARRRHLDAALLRRSVETASDVLARIAAWPSPAVPAKHAASLAALAGEALGWSDAAPERRSLDEDGIEALEALPELPLAYDELVLVLRGRLRDAGSEVLGGCGAGVSVLSVVEARARTFDRLFVLGMNRDVFPRPVIQDALFPDDARARLLEVLPEMPVKARGFEEEHHLFAELLSASPHVTLSWQVADEEGKARSPSPFVERLRVADGRLPEPVAAVGLYAPPARSADLPRTAAEAALVAGLQGAHDAARALLAVALEEQAELVGEPIPPDEARRLADGRWRIIDEMGRTGGVGPYLGFVGAGRHPKDLRRNPLYVTGVEGLVWCPWQVFLKRLLGLEPPPDALDALPECTPLLLGSVVHATLERIVRAALADAGEGLSHVAAGAGVEVPWPETAALDAALEEAAAELVRREGIGPPAFASVLAHVAKPLVERARDLGWPGPGSGVRCLGVEVVGEVTLADETLRFRADRVDRSGERLRLVDYKTGKPLKADKLLEAVTAGGNLQVPAYALGADGEGRYLYLKAEDGAGVVAGEADDPELADAFRASVEAALGVWRSGAFVPRLTGPGDDAAHEHCGWCEVREACLQGDARARRRVRAWAGEGGGDPAERAARVLWSLPERSPA